VFDPKIIRLNVVSPLPPFFAAAGAATKSIAVPCPIMVRLVLFLVAVAGVLPAAAATEKTFEEAVMGKVNMEHYDPLTLALLQNDSPCTGPPSITKDQCLGKAADCMFIETDAKNICLPCKLGAVDIPCVPVGSIYAMKKVTDCQMKCGHQSILQKDGGIACTDVSGAISSSQCFAKGTTALTTCMWTAYTDASGAGKSSCGPCKVTGIGKIPCATPGMLGPEPGSTVGGCLSMCDAAVTEWGVPCDGGLGIPAVTDCHPVPLPPAPPPAPIPLNILRIHTDKNAPEYYAADVPPPYGVKQYTMASEVAAMAAGWPAPGEELPPDAPVVIYGTPPFEGPTLPPTLKVMYGPPPPGIPGVPPPGYGMGTAPPPENVAAAAKQLIQLGSRTGPAAPRSSKLRLRRKARWAKSEAK